MSLVTRCPGCATAFRVLPGQLAARGGQVRCGKCNTVFDGIAALVDEARAPKPSRPAVPEPRAAAREELPEEPLPPFLAATLGPDGLLAASAIADPAVEDYFARRAVEDVLEVRVPVRL